MRKALLAVACLSLLAPARAEDAPPPTSWADPLLEDALLTARIVVRGHVRAPLAGETQPRLDIEKIVAGDGKPGVSVPLWGTKGPPSLDKLLTRLRPGDEGIFILRQAGELEKPRLEIPTPSFGRFVIKDGRVVGFPRSSFVSVEMKAEDYETFLKAAWASVNGQRPDPAFIESCRATLSKLTPTAADAAVPAHVALEGLRYGAEAKDAKLAARFFAAAPYQVRVSAARVLLHAGGEDAAASLLHVALHDPDPVVASVAIECIARVRPTPKDAARELVARMKDLDARSTMLHVNVEDPRANEQKSPLMAAFETVRALGAGDDATKVALELLAKDEAEPFMAGVLHLAKMKARARCGDVVKKFRPPENPYGFFNEKLGELMEELTGAQLGDKRNKKDAWAAWLAENEKK